MPNQTTLSLGHLVTFSVDHIATLWAGIVASPRWDLFKLGASKPPSSSIFGFAEYLTALALLLVVVTSSDFRYRYRLLIAQRHPQWSGFIIALFVGIGVLATDVWYQNEWPVPTILANANNLKAFFAVVLLSSLCRLASIAVIHPARFKK